eukprot:1443159-Amphidinium_carterae.1
MGSLRSRAATLLLWAVVVVLTMPCMPEKSFLAQSRGHIMRRGKLATQVVRAAQKGDDETKVERTGGLGSHNLGITIVNGSATERSLFIGCSGMFIQKRDETGELFKASIVWGTVLGHIGDQEDSLNVVRAKKSDQNS